MTERVIAWIDGGSRGNPGPAGYGATIEDGAGRVLDELTGAIGVATNNAAEYRGLIAALEYLVAHGHRDVVIRSDSELLARQMRGEYRVRHETLRRLHARALELAGRLGHVRYEHVPRGRNRRADALANAAMDGTAMEGVPGVPAGTETAGGAVARVTADSRPPPARGAAAAGVTAPPEAVVAAGGGGIVGIGIDIEEVARVDDLVQRYGERFIARVFTEGEATYCRRRRFPAQHLAARFSAKEATMKALGTGRSRGVLWRDIEVVRRSGPPQLALHGGARRRFEALGATGALLTLTHSRHLSIAQVVLLGR